MELSRRDAVAALAAIGATGGATLGARRLGRGEEAPNSEADLPGDESVKTTMIAIATVVYPDAVTGIEPFVDEYLDGRLVKSSHSTGLRETVAEVQHLAITWYDSPVATLAPETRDQLLREVGADTAEEDPTGTLAEQVRYFVVNELLLALYASPKGGTLVGIENPQGHPGGVESYAQGP